MTREDLLKSKEYWLIQIQNDLFGILEEYMKKEKLNRTQLAERFNVTKGYITQIFSGDFDHKVSKLVDLSLSSGKAPVISFVDLDSFIKEDSKGKIFDLMPMTRPVSAMFETKKPEKKKKETKKELL